MSGGVLAMCQDVARYAAGRASDVLYQTILSYLTHHRKIMIPSIIAIPFW